MIYCAKYNMIFRCVYYWCTTTAIMALQHKCGGVHVHWRFVSKFTRFGGQTQPPTSDDVIVVCVGFVQNSSTSQCAMEHLHLILFFLVFETLSLVVQVEYSHNFSHSSFCHNSLVVQTSLGSLTSIYTYTVCYILKRENISHIHFK